MKNKLLSLSKRILIVVLAIHFTSAFLQSQPIKGSWKSITKMPTARWFPGTAVYDGKIYVIGGNTSSSTAPLKVVEVYNPASDTWETKTSIPTRRAQVSACTYNGKIYVIGGSSGPSNWTPVPDNYIYDPASDTWSKGADMPSPRTELALVAVKDKIYAIGGIDGSSTGSKSVDIYDPAANSWSKGADMPTARGTMPACALDGKIYVFGGSNGNASNWNHYATVEMYDIETNTWSAKKDMPFSRSHLSGCVLNNKIFALGGTEIDKNMSYAAMASYNPQTNTWESEPSMITAREAFKAVVVNGKIYAIGGTQYPSLVAFPNSEVYDTVPKVFISKTEMRLPVHKDGFIGKLFVPNSGSLKFTYHINDTLFDGALYAVRTDSLVAARDLGLNANKKFQIEILAISENNDSVKTTIQLSTFFQVDATYSAPDGFLLESSDKKVMVDVLTSKTPGYGFQANSNEIYDSMKNAAEPFNHIDLIYTSHPHACHFDEELLLNAMLKNPKAISVMGVPVKKLMEKYFAANPGIESQIFAPEIPVNSSVDTTLAGIKIRLTNIVHEGSTTLSLNILLDSIHFVHFDEYNSLTAADYKTIGFTQLPADVALLGALLLNGDKPMIKATYSPSDYITVAHITNIATSYSSFVTEADKLKALNYQVNIPRWPMEMFSYKKVDNKMSLSILNSAPKVNKTFPELTLAKGDTIKVYIPKSSFKDADPGDVITYKLSIDGKPLPDWAKFDTLTQNLVLTPTVVKTYTVIITATDNHLSFNTTNFKVKVTELLVVKNQVINNNFKVFPNPARSIVNIENPGDNNSSYSVDLYNMLGEKIYSGKECRDSKTIVDLSKFSETVLFLKITGNGKTECHKIIRY
jgi:N-acetylneuraminic acid mutarotase